MRIWKQCIATLVICLTISQLQGQKTSSDRLRELPGWDAETKNTSTFIGFSDLKLSWRIQKRSNEKANIKIAKKNKNLIIVSLLSVVLSFEELVTSRK